MASDMEDGDYLGAYHRFFVDFLDKVNPDDQLPIKTSGYDVTEGEIVGEIIHMTLQYLDQQRCPPNLQCYIVQLVIEEIKSTCRKQPESCGFRQEEKTYAPLQLMQAVAGKVNEICERYVENSRLALLPPPPSTPMPLATAFAIRNSRRKMEDRHVILHDLNTIFNIKDDSIASYYAVFDGHAGYQAAVFCATHLHQYLAESRHYPTDPERALRDAFLTTDARFIQKSTRQTLSSGTTAVCALILNRKLYVAWAGDSQAALAKRGTVTQLVNPHKPDRNDERERVEEMGGTVLHLGIWRVNGNLAVSRAIGDAQYKPYVTGDPEIRCISLDGDEDFLIIACDGLWDCVTENDAATLVYRDLYRNPHNYASASQRLVEYAKSQGSIDNITVIVVFLTSPRQINSRSVYAPPILADVLLNNMNPDNRYLSNANGQFDVNSQFVKQQTTANNGTNELMMDDDEYENYGNKSSNGKRHENGDQVADYDAEDDDDLGPETDVDAVDDVSESIPTLANVSRQLFTEKPDPSEIYRNEEECMDDDSPPSPPRATKTNQQALIPEADNVGDSEDSEDEWNYYRIDPNKEKEESAEAAAFGNVEKAENVSSDDVAPPSSNIEREDIIALEKEPESVKDDSETSSDSESEREIRPSALIDNEISADTNFELRATTPLEKEIDTETEKTDAQEEKEAPTRDEEIEKYTEEEMDFQLNPDAAEFIPISPTHTMPARIDLVDTPISGSPLKQTPPMDDIKIPSRREFENEIRCRPHEIDEKNCTNGQISNDLEELAMDKPDSSMLAANLDESEVSSTKAEFGDESSFLTTSEFHGTGISTLEGSFTGSYADFDDSTIDPMTKSFGPGDFVSLSNPVDLNAVHDLTDTGFANEEAVYPRTVDGNKETVHQEDEFDDELREARSPINPLLDEQSTDDLLDSPHISSPRSLVDEAQSPVDPEDKQNPLLDYFSSEVLQPESVETKPIERSDIDDFVDDRSITETHDIPADYDATNVTTKLLEMDLEDRGSQDCEFEKCNEKWSGEEEAKESLSKMVNEETDVPVSPVPLDNLVEQEAFSLPETLTFEATTRVEECEIDKLAETLSDLRANAEEFSPQNTATPDVPVLHNPLDLNVEAPVTISHDNIILEDETFSNDHDIVKDLESPGVGVSPLVESQLTNPFENAEYGLSSSCTKPQDFDFLKISDEAEDTTIMNQETVVEQEKIVEDEMVMEHETRLEQKTPVEQEPHLEQKTPVEQEPHLEQKTPVEQEPHLEQEALLEQETPLEQEAILDHKTFTESETLLVHETPLETEEIANVSSDLKLSESLQEFTGLEQQLNPEKLSNGHENHLLDIHDDEAKDVTVPTNIVFEASEEVCAKPIVEEVSKSVEEIYEEVPKQVAEIDEEVSKPVEEIIEEVSKPVEEVIEQISQPVEEILEQVPDPVEAVVEQVSEPVETIIEKVSEPIEPIVEKASEPVEPIIEQVSEPVEPIVEQVSEPAQPIVEQVSEPVEAIVEQVSKPVEPIPEQETKAIEEQTEKEEPTIDIKKASIVAAVAATVAAAGTAAAVKSTKAKPLAKTAPKAATAAKTGTNKSTPTSPTKPAGTATRTSTVTAAKRTTTVTAAARPTKLDTAGKTTATAKTTTTSAAPKTGLNAPKATGRLSTSSPRTKASPIGAATKTTASSLAEKKPTTNGDATKPATANNRVTSTSARAPSKPLVKSSTLTAAKATNASSATTTTTSISKTRVTSATTATSKLASKTSTITGSAGTTTQRPKTAPSIGSANLAAKTRLSSSTKSPITEKQIKESANKQISSSRTSTNTTASKTSRISGSTTSTTSTKRATATKTSSTTANANNTATQAIPPPIRKPASMTTRAPSKTATANGKTTSTKVSTSTATKTKVVENGVCTSEQGTTIVTSTTTMMSTSDSNEEDVPKKDLSPVEPLTDNQLIMTAD